MIMTIREFLIKYLREHRKEDVILKYGAGYYTFYINDFKIINNANGTGLVIPKVLDEMIEIVKGGEANETYNIKRNV